MILDQNILTMRDAAKRLPTRPHVSTVIRWAERGCRGQRLKTWLIGGSRVTSEEALAEFLSGLNGERVETTRKRAKEIEAAEHALDVAGI
jgi:formamidopyrimidine-DNA glycosylase